MAPRTPPRLRKKRAELAYERQTLAARLVEVDRELAAVDYALHVLDPAWLAPRTVTKPRQPLALPVGTIAQTCLLVMRQHGAPLWSAEVAALVAERHKLCLTGKAAKQRFGSSVSMALRRYERQGVLEVVEQHTYTKALRWRLRTTPEGRLSLAPRAA